MEFLYYQFALNEDKNYSKPTKYFWEKLCSKRTLSATIPYRNDNCGNLIPYLVYGLIIAPKFKIGHHSLLCCHYLNYRKNITFARMT